MILAKFHENRLRLIDCEIVEKHALQDNVTCDIDYRIQIIFLF